MSQSTHMTDQAAAEILTLLYASAAIRSSRLARTTTSLRPRPSIRCVDIGPNKIYMQKVPISRPQVLIPSVSPPPLRQHLAGQLSAENPTFQVGKLSCGANLPGIVNIKHHPLPKVPLFQPPNKHHPR